MYVKLVPVIFAQSMILLISSGFRFCEKIVKIHFIGLPDASLIAIISSRNSQNFQFPI
ncbi:MAG: hypothetical protein LBC61_01080 [Candidatus Peribacteria bacterium]|nr:hypothetical protein [Candidatus Peribacteria bacterium]